MLPEECLFEDNNLDDLVKKILDYKKINTDDLYNIVKDNHSLNNTVEKIIKSLISDGVKGSGSGSYYNMYIIINLKTTDCHYKPRKIIWQTFSSINCPGSIFLLSRRN